MNRLRKIWTWIKARPRWIWGALAAVAATVALAFRTSGGEVVPEPRAPSLPPAPPPVPPILREEAAHAAVEAQEARTAPSDMDLDEVAAGLARHARKP